MKYKTLMAKILKELNEYKSIVDDTAIVYLKECNEHKRELEKMQKKFTPEYIKEFDKNWQPKGNYGDIISAAKEKHRKTALDCLDKIRKEVESYFKTPVNQSFLMTIMGIKILGLNLTNRELSLLQDSAEGYLSRRLLSELSISRTSKTDKVKLNESNEPERIRVDEPKPFNGITVPDIEETYNCLQHLENTINTAFSYCGENYELRDIVFPISKTTEETNAKIEEAYGVKAQPQKLDNMTISRMASSVKCFDENHSAYTAFSEMMGELAATMSEPKRKTTLTDSDRNLIDSMIDSRYEHSAREQAVKIAQADERMAQILQLDERYGPFVQQALAEVSDNE